MTSECPKCHGDESLRPCEYCGAERRIPPGHVGIVDPPSEPLVEVKTCRVHGPTVEVRWITLGPCPLCQSYAVERLLREALEEMSDERRCAGYAVTMEEEED